MAGDILAANGRPFRDRDAAEIKRQILVAELDEPFLVVDHPDGGFAVRRHAATAHPDHGVMAHSGEEPTEPSVRPRPYDVGPSPLEELQEDVTDTPAQQESAEPLANAETRSRTEHQAHLQERLHADAPPRVSGASASSYRDAFRLHPAPRAFLFQHLFSFLGVLLMFQPHRVLAIAGMSLPDNPQLAGASLGLTALAGLAIALISTSRFLWQYLSNTYIVTPDSVQQIHWYFDGPRLRRAKPQIDFVHLSTIDVDQGVMQMLLGVGRIRMATGGTDTHEITMKHILHPAQLANEFRRRYTQATGRRLDRAID